VPLSPARTLQTGGRRPDVLTKLKSVLVLPDAASEDTLACRNHGGGQSQNHDLSREWTLVKSKRDTCVAGHPSSAATSIRGNQHVSSAARSRLLLPELKKVFRGKCFHYLATDHQVAQCREPSRCINCLGRGHFARHYISPPALLPQTSIHSRLSFPKPSIHSRLTFPLVPSIVKSPSRSSLMPP
jgi:hypothetical protein